MIKIKGRLFRLAVLCVLVPVLALSLLLCVGMSSETASVAYAAETSVAEDGVDGETPAPPADEPESEPEPAPPEEGGISQVAEGIAAFFDRIIEWVTVHRAEVITVIGNIVVVIYMIAKNIKSKKKLVEIGTNVLSVKDGVANTNTKQGEVVNVTNELIEGYNRFETALNDFGKTEQERFKTMLAAYAETRAILKIMTTVYANSKNIPQGVKDLVNLEYADVLKLVGDEEKLKALMESEKTENTAAGEVDKSAEG